jgi:UDP-N-acetylmuramyl pentapeptide phosphotransferase/UDP-N-acetylglucosamine-1-phosphate transferase
VIGAAILAVCGLASAAGTAFLRSYARRRNLFDTPNQRSSHSVPTPRLGGVAIASAAVGAWVALLAAGLLPARAAGAAMAGGLVIVVVGLIDDLRTLAPAAKLAGQVMAVGVAIAVWDPVTVRSLLPLSALALFMLLYINFFNFMDGSDGLAAGVAVCSAAGLAVVAGAGNGAAMSWGALAVAAAAAGFLVHNFPPASIFMGDAGSLFLGFALAFEAVVVSDSGIGALPPILVLTPFLFDAGYTLILRLLDGEAVWQAHRRHIYQRLLKTGASHAAVAFCYWAWTLLSTALAIALTQASPQLQAGLVLAALAPGVGLAAVARHRERASLVRLSARDGGEGNIPAH